MKEKINGNILELFLGAIMTSEFFSDFDTEDDNENVHSDEKNSEIFRMKKPNSVLN